MFSQLVWPIEFMRVPAMFACVSRIIRVRVVSQESEDAVKALAKEKDLLEREKWDLRRQTKEATEHTGMLRSQLDLKENRIKELEAELAMVRTPLGVGTTADRQAVAFWL